MSVRYRYTDKATSPNFQQIQTDVAASAMTDKTIEGCAWHQDANLPARQANTLEVVFTNDLSAGDKTLLDTIVANNS